MSNDPDLISLKELASKLKVSDALLKKIIKDFGIETARDEKRICLSEKSVQTVREILALRASGKKNQEIKEMFDASMTDSNSEASPKQEELVTQSETILEVKPETSDTEINPDEGSTNNRKNNSRFKKNKKKNQSPQEEPKEKENLDISGFLNDTEDAKASSLFGDDDDDNDLPTEASETNTDEDLDLEDDDDDDENKKSNQGKSRRRSFSFRYIQKQIMNDTKRINYIKSKLKRGRISATEKMILTDSLEHRSSLLSGWQHMLRWVKS